MISEIKPDTVQYLNNNKYYYNYNIKSSTIEVTDEDGNTKQIEQYEYIPIKLNGTPDYKQCAKAVIRYYIEEEEEFSLINDYNAYKLGVLDDPNIEEEYLDYLNLLQEIKSKVRADFGI